MFFISILGLIITCVNLVSTESTYCGNWTEFGEEKCIQIIDREKVVNYENAVEICSQTQKSHLITITSDNEQKFLENYLFKDKQIVDNVWIGLKNENGFKWSDKSSVDYSNWFDKSHLNNTDQNCTQISTENVVRGKWVNEYCNKKAVVICQIIIGCKKFIKENRNLNIVNENLSKEVANLHKDNNNLVKEVGDLNKEIENLHKKDGDLLKENINLHNETSILRKENENLKSKLNSCENNIQDLMKNKLISRIKQFHSHYNISNPFIDFDNKHKVLFTVWNNTYKDIYGTDSSFSLCESLNSTIIEIRSKQKQEIVDKIFIEWFYEKYNGAWLNGMRDSSGKWRWNTDGMEFNYTNWHKSDPKTGSDFKLVKINFYVSRSSVWESTSNSQSEAIICEYELK